MFKKLTIITIMASSMSIPIISNDIKDIAWKPSKTSCDHTSQWNRVMCLAENQVVSRIVSMIVNNKSAVDSSWYLEAEAGEQREPARSREVLWYHTLDIFIGNFGKTNS